MRAYYKPNNRKSKTLTKTSILYSILLLFFLQSNIHAQDDDWHKNPSLQYHDSLIVVNNDSLWIICGINPEYDITFLSRDLFLKIKHQKEVSNRPILDLFEEFPDDFYLSKFQDTTYWQSFDESKLGLCLRYPGNLKPVTNVKNREIEFVEKGNLCLRISFTTRTFSYEAKSHGWYQKYKNQWLVFESDPYDAGLQDVVYIKGQNWKCLRAIQPFVFYDENTGKGYGDKLKFFAMKEINKNNSLIIELTCANSGILEGELFTMLSSIKFENK